MRVVFARKSVVGMLVLLAGMLAANAQVPIPPFITGISPTSGPTVGGTIVTITGTNFGATTGTVSFGGVLYAPTSWSPTSVTFATPIGQGLNRQVGLRSSAGLPGLSPVPFNYAAPTIAGLGLQLLPPATFVEVEVGTTGQEEVYIFGTNLGASPIVTVNGAPVPATQMDAVNHGIVKITSPPGVGRDQTLQAVVGGQTSNVNTDLSYAPPLVVYLTTQFLDPQSTTTVGVYGANFGPSAQQVTVGGSPVTINSWSDSYIEFTIPSGQGVNLPVVVTVAGQTSAPAFVSYGYPNVTGISTAWAEVTGGTSVTIFGENFSGFQPYAILDGRPMNVTAFTTTSLVFEVAKGEGMHLDLEVGSETFQDEFQGVISYGYGTDTNKCLAFDGVDDVVILQPTATELSNAASFSIDCWFQYDGAQTSGIEPTLCAMRDAGSSGAGDLIRIYLSNGKVCLDIQALSVTGQRNVLDGNPHHLLVTFDYGTVNIFIDGELDVELWQFMNFSAAANADLSIGHRLNSQGLPMSSIYAWNGRIDELRIWQNLWAWPQPAARIWRTTLSTVEWGYLYGFHFDETQGQSFANASAVGNDASAQRGLVSYADPSDPQIVSGIAQLPAIISSGGQNRDEASLRVNGIGDRCGRGPFVVQVTDGDILELNWNGPEFAPIILAAGPRHPAAASPACVGTIDIGTPPYYTDVVILFDGNRTYFPDVLFKLDPWGEATHAFTIPFLPAGEFLNLQGIVFQPSGCPVYMTAAFYIEGV